MPVEVIGEAVTPGASRKWIDAEYHLAMKHLKNVCGESPRETELEVQCQHLLFAIKVLTRLPESKYRSSLIRPSS